MGVKLTPTQLHLFFLGIVLNIRLTSPENKMLSELRAEILELRQDGVFIRNLSLTSIIAIAFFCGFSELQSHTTSAIAPEVVLLNNVSK